MRTSLFTLAALFSATKAYNYIDAGASWIALPDNECAGRAQTPINLPRGYGYENFASTVYQQDIGFSVSGWADTNKATYVDKEKTVHVSVANGGQVKLDNRDMFNDGTEDFDFTIVQYHIHSPSEHTIDGRYYDAELHFVHTTN